MEKYSYFLNIANLNWEVIIHGFDKRVLKFLYEYFEPHLNASKKPDVVVELHCGKNRVSNQLPYTMDFGRALVTWNPSDPLHVRVHIRKFFCRPSIIPSLLFKAINREFNLPLGYIGQIFFENIVYPTIILFLTDRTVLLHSSCVANEKGEAILFSGHGGVGKTTLELKFIIEKKYHFLADDFTFIAQKKVFLNNAFPKIYHYNVRVQRKLREKLLEELSLPSKIHFYLWGYLPILRNKVRRKVNPKYFFASEMIKSAVLKKVFFILRGKRFLVRQLDPKGFAEIAWRILLDEYRIVFIKIDKSMLLSLKKQYIKNLSWNLTDADIRFISIPKHFGINKTYAIINNLVEQ